MNEQRFHRVADTGPLHFCVENDSLGHVEIGRAIDIDMTVARKMLDDGHPGFGGHAADQPFAAARNRHGDMLVEPQEMPHGLAIGRLDKLHGVRRQADFAQGFRQDFDDRAA